MATIRLVTATDADNPNLHDLYLDESGQLEIIGTDITDTADYARSVAQSVKCRILLVKGEWYQDQRLGTPWREKIWKKGTSNQVLYGIIRDVVLGTPGVRSLEAMDISTDATSRTATVSNMRVITETGVAVTVTDIDEPMIISAPEGTL